MTETVATSRLLIILPILVIALCFVYVRLPSNSSNSTTKSAKFLKLNQKEVINLLFSFHKLKFIQIQQECTECPEAIKEGKCIDQSKPVLGIYFFVLM
jgi:sensor histidine kinase YesM